MSDEFKNWSGSIVFKPEVMHLPETEEDVQQIVKQAIEKGKKVKVTGAGHSSMPLMETPYVLVAQNRIHGIVNHDMEKHQVDIRPGTSIAESGKEMIMLRMGMHNFGDVDFQLIAGAFATGTHGSGITLQNLSGALIGCRLVDGKGNIREFHRDTDKEHMQAIQVSLGALGILTEMKLQLQPAEKFIRREFCCHIDECLENLDMLMNDNRMFDFYWYPRSDVAKIRICNAEEEGRKDYDFADLEKEEEGWLVDVLPNFRDLKFEEMEYAIPIDKGVECFKEVRKRIKEKHRDYVGWRVLCRTVAEDDAFISPFYKQTSMTIAILQNVGLEHDRYFTDMEPLFREFGGKPHYGKKHSLKARELKPLFPEWDKFMQIREELDPDGIFLNHHLKELFGL